MRRLEYWSMCTVQLPRWSVPHLPGTGEVLQDHARGLERDLARSSRGGLLPVQDALHVRLRHLGTQQITRLRNLNRNERNFRFRP